MSSTPLVVLVPPAPVTASGNGSAPVEVAPATSTPLPVPTPTTIKEVRTLARNIATIGFVRKPTYARNAGQHWSTAEQTLVEHAFCTAGLAAAYNAVPHRTKPAVRGWLQRRGLIAPNTPPTQP